MGARALRAITGDTWAIRPEVLDDIMAIAAREHEFAGGNLEALEQRLGRPLNNTERATVRDGVAVIPVTGPLFRYANLMTQVSGATSYATLATDFRAALDDPSVTAIVLQMDSPGGQVNGVNELAKQIREARGVKPVVAYVGGQAASAGYWLASAADEIIADEVATVGSIGAMIGVSMREGDRPGEKSYSFVSSQSPLKNASPGTAEGAREIQRLVDELAQVFVETVAANRGISAEDVLEKYGQGAVFTGAEALKRGMIDGVSTLEAVIARFGNGRPAAFGGIYRGASLMDTKKAGAESTLPEKITAEWVAQNHPAVAEALRAEGAASVDTAAIEAAARAAGAAAERERITGIEAFAKPGLEAVVAECKADPAMTVEKAAVKILQAMSAVPSAMPAAALGGAAHLSNLQQTESALDAPEAGSGADKALSPLDAARAAVALARKAGINA